MGSKLKNGLKIKKWATDPCGPNFCGGAKLHPHSFSGPRGIAQRRAQVEYKLLTAFSTIEGRYLTVLEGNLPSNR